MGFEDIILQANGDQEVPVEVPPLVSPPEDKGKFVDSAVQEAPGWKKFAAGAGSAAMKPILGTEQLVNKFWPSDSVPFPSADSDEADWESLGSGLDKTKEGRYGKVAGEVGKAILMPNKAWAWGLEQFLEPGEMTERAGHGALGALTTLGGNAAVNALTRTGNATAGVVRPGLEEVGKQNKFLADNGVDMPLSILGQAHPEVMHDAPFASKAVGWAGRKFNIFGPESQQKMAGQFMNLLQKENPDLEAVMSKDPSIAKRVQSLLPDMINSPDGGLNRVIASAYAANDAASRTLWDAFGKKLLSTNTTSITPHESLPAIQDLIRRYPQYIGEIPDQTERALVQNFASAANAQEARQIIGGDPMKLITIKRALGDMLDGVRSTNKLPTDNAQVQRAFNSTYSSILNDLNKWGGNVRNASSYQALQKATKYSKENAYPFGNNPISKPLLSSDPGQFANKSNLATMARIGNPKNADLIDMLPISNDWEYSNNIINSTRDFAPWLLKKNPHLSDDAPLLPLLEGGRHGIAGSVTALGAEGALSALDKSRALKALTMAPGHFAGRYGVQASNILRRGAGVAARHYTEGYQ